MDKISILNRFVNGSKNLFISANLHSLKKTKDIQNKLVKSSDSESESKKMSEIIEFESQYTNVPYFRHLNISIIFNHLN